MTALLPSRRELEASIVTLREQIAPRATDQELAYFAAVCHRVGLSPFAEQICFVPRWDGRVKREVHRPQIQVAGRRVLAERTGELRGIDGPQWCGPRAHEGADLVWSDVWTGDGYPYAARVFVYRAEWVKPANGTVKWSEFCQTDKEGALLRLWSAMPSHMLGKVAESLALRRAFPDVIPEALDVGLGYAGDDLNAAELVEVELAGTPAEVDRVAPDPDPEVERHVDVETGEVDPVPEVDPAPAGPPIRKAQRAEIERLCAERFVPDRMVPADLGALNYDMARVLIVELQALPERPNL